MGRPNSASLLAPEAGMNAMFMPRPGSDRLDIARILTNRSFTIFETDNQPNWLPQIDGLS